MIEFIIEVLLLIAYVYCKEPYMIIAAGLFAIAANIPDLHRKE